MHQHPPTHLSSAIVQLTKKANAEELAAFKCSEGLLGIVLEAST